MPQHRVQTRYSATAGQLPPTDTRPGVLTVNTADRKLYAVDATGNQTLVAVALLEYNPGGHYVPGDLAIQARLLWRCVTATTGPWAADHWESLMDGADADIDAGYY